MNLLTNAIEAIRVGVEDYDVGTRPRLLSAVRNVYAGVLLIFKEALRRRSPPGSDEVLLKARVSLQTDSSGAVVAVGTGRNTVDTRQIRERFTDLGIAADWERVEKIRSLRNDIEHYYPSVGVGAIQGAIANTFLIVRDFVSTELGEDPRRLLGEATWDLMLQTKDVYEAERKACGASFELVEWCSPVLSDAVRDLRCTECGSDLLSVKTEPGATLEDVSLDCRSCGHIERSPALISRAVVDGLSHEHYLAFTDGNELPYVVCPECSEEAYVVEEERCAYCAYEAEHTCIACSSRIPPEELDSSPYCGWCAHMMSKDD